MKLLKKTKSIRRVPRISSTVEMKVSEYNRRFANRKNNSPSPLTLTFKGKKVESAASITVNGKSLTELYPDAKPEDVQKFLKDLEQEAAPASRGNDYENTLGKSFRSIKKGLAKSNKQYDEKLGKSFRNLQRGMQNKKSRVFNKQIKSSAPKLEPAVQEEKTDKVKVTKEKTTEEKTTEKKTAEVKTLEVKTADVEVAEVETTEKAPTQEDTTALIKEMTAALNDVVATILVPDLVPDLYAAMTMGSLYEAVELKDVMEKEDSKEEAVPKAEEEAVTEETTEEEAVPVVEAPEEVAAPVEEALEDLAALVEEVTKEVAEPVEEVTKEVAEPVEEVTKEVAEPVEEVTKKVAEPVEEVTKEVAAPVEETYKVAVAEPTEAVVEDDASLEKMDTPKTESPLVATEKAETHVEKIEKEDTDSVVAQCYPELLQEDINLEANIEAVEQNGNVLIGFYQPEIPSVAVEEDEDDMLDYSTAVYNLSVMIDGAVVQTVALGSAGMELVHRFFTREEEDDEDRSQAPEENDCPRGKISIPSSNSDLYQDQAPQSDVANDKKESEQTYSSSIFEKMNRCWVDTTAGSNKLTEPSICTVSLMTEGPEDDNRNDWAEYTNREISEEVRS